jgi:polar amino acid transport system substrate-binding protein
MRFTVAFFALMAVLLAAPARADDAAAKRELAPNGKLRVAIAVGPAPSAIYAVKDGTGHRGVTIVLGTALAQKLGVPVEWVAYLASGEIQASAASGAWDVSFMPVDEERKKFVDFGNAYHLLQSTYLVAPGSPITSIAEANAPGVRIAGVAGTATFRASNKASPQATHLAFAGVDAAVTAMRTGQADLIALGRESLTGLAPKISGSRVLDGGFLNSTTAVAVPKGHAEALAYASAFIEDAKASGTVRRAFDDMGLTSSQVAPAGMKP